MPKTYLTGIDALVQLVMMQRRRDAAAGRNTAGFVSGYRGSPLGTVDMAMQQSAAELQRHNIKFAPGVNEDLAATAVWGTQQAHLLPRAKYDGVFALWYGKGPGVDRSMDAFKHGNAFGTTQYGGVLAAAGDDHGCKSSTLPHQSEFMFAAAALPVLHPADVQEVLDYGIIGWALSRFCGCWVGLKAVGECMDSAASVTVEASRVAIVTPQFDAPEGGLNARWPCTPLEQEELLHSHRIPAALAFARANNLNRVTNDSPAAKLGIVTAGKAHLDALEALHELGIDETDVRVLKVGMSWPLESESVQQFAAGLEEILVVEEKRDLIESQLRAQVYASPSRPRIVGKQDEHGRPLLSALAELTPGKVARAIGGRWLQFEGDATARESVKRHLEFLDALDSRAGGAAAERTPYFCSGCPHNTSTRVPADSVGLAGIGCHYMAKWMHRNTELFTQMGGEGASWIGIAPFTDTQHAFQNIGDGTYFHSGLLAVRAAVAAGVNITYKLLLNDAVAMTGGQAVDGALTSATAAAQLLAEGVREVVVVAEDAAAAKAMLRAAGVGVEVHARDSFDALQLRLREVPGVTAIIYDQVCASEKRRRRKRGAMPAAGARVFINAAVCEGCGDCGAASNCLSVLPAASELGVKRRIDQDACNADFSCLDGFCPSFVTVTGGDGGGGFDAGDEKVLPDVELPAPVLPAVARPWNVLIAGVGGTGVLTVGGIIAMAAQLEGRDFKLLNQTGLAQKFGAVLSHVRLGGGGGGGGAGESDIHAARIGDGGVDLLLGCDLTVAAMADALAAMHSARATAVVNDAENPTAEFLHDAAYRFAGEAMRDAIRAASAAAEFVDATRIAREVLGHAIGGNLFLLGYAYQRGLLPLTAAAVDEAIGVNGVEVEFNRRAFALGRQAAVDWSTVAALASDDSVAPLQDLDEVIDYRRRYLTAYQNENYAAKYTELVARVRAAEAGLPAAADEELTAAVARNYFKLLAYKDEYEVARLYCNGDFAAAVEKQFGAGAKLHFHLAPPVFARKDALTGRPRKRRLPGAMMHLFRLLAPLKFLRGTAFDPFGYSRERKMERRLVGDYEADVEAVLTRAGDDYDAAVALAELPAMVKGFGHVKAAAAARYYARREELQAGLQRPKN